MKIRHGDVVLEQVDEIPEQAKSLGKRRELAFGEVTGHAHRVDIGELFEAKNGELYLKVGKLANLTHEEHKSAKLKPRFYRIVIKQQYIPGWMTQKVTD